jgi:hypothetical protein
MPLMPRQSVRRQRPSMRFVPVKDEEQQVEQRRVPGP